MANLEKRICTCGKEFEISKFAPKTTTCSECTIKRISEKRSQKKTFVQQVAELPELVPVVHVDEAEIDTDPFSIISAYNLFGKEAIYVWLLLREFKVSKTGVLFKQFNDVYMVAPLHKDVKFVVSLLNGTGEDVTISSVADIEELPENMVVDLLPIASLLWPKRQEGGAK